MFPRLLGGRPIPGLRHSVARRAQGRGQASHRYLRNKRVAVSRASQGSDAVAPLAGLPIEEGARGGKFVRDIIEQFGQGVFQVLGVPTGCLFLTHHAMGQVQGPHQ
jgi:hypothetical protein